MQLSDLLVGKAEVYHLLQCSSIHGDLLIWKSILSDHLSITKETQPQGLTRNLPDERCFRQC
jgi:hypothetical protein